MSTTETTFEELLQFLKRQRGFDFTGYKRASLERRIAKRMEAVGVDELRRATSTTSRSTPRSSRRSSTRSSSTSPGSSATRRAWDVPRRATSSRSCSRRGPTAAPIRVWSAGCASGEEAYTVAMLLAEALGEEAFLERVKIYATDVDEEALDAGAARRLPREGARGRAARAAASATSSAPTRATRSARDLRRDGDLRPQRPRAGRADLAHRPAAVPQHAHVLQRGDAGADPARASTSRCSRHGLPVPRASRRCCITHADLFEPADLKRRVFTKVPQPALRDRLSFVAGGRRGCGRRRPDRVAARQRVRRRAGRADRRRPRRRASRPRTSAARAAASASGASDIGRPAPGPRALLPAGRAARRARRARSRRAPRSRSAVGARRQAGGRALVLDVAITPLLGRRRARSARAITFLDVTEADAAATSELERSQARARARPTRSCSRRSRSSRRPTRSSSRPTRSSRRPTRSSSRPTRSSRR